MREVEAYSRLAGVYDDVVVDPCYVDWAHFLDGVWRADARGVIDVLDACCGTGLMAAELSALGYHVVGFDASQEMLDRARELLGPDAKLYCQALPDVALPGRFDAVISTYDGLNYLPPADFTRSLAVLGGSLRAGGWLIFDLHTDVMLELARDRDQVHGSWPGGTFAVSYDVDIPERTVTSHIEVVQDDDVYAEEHPQYIHSAEQTRAALTAAGFTAIAVVDNYSGRPAGPSTLRATYVARRR
jgi:SAM-dependent methyltransferase